MLPTAYRYKVRRYLDPSDVYAGHFSRALADLAGFYLGLGGDPAFVLPKELHKARKALEEEVNGLVTGRLLGDVPDWLYLQLDHRYGISPFWTLNVRLEFGSYFLMKVDFLDALSARNPRFYRLVRRALLSIAAFCPVVTTADVFEDWSFEDYIEMLDGEDEESQALANDAREEYNAFVDHLPRSAAPPAESVRPWARRARKRLGSMGLKKKELEWMKCALDLMERIPDTRTFPFVPGGKLRQEDQERVGVSHFFNLLWREESFMSEMSVEQTTNMAMECGGPVVILEAKAAADLEPIGRCVGFLSLMGEFFIKGYQLWK